VTDSQKNSQPTSKAGFSLSGLISGQTKTDRLKPVLPVRCEDIESLAVLLACDELDTGARAELDAHVAQCPACAAVVAREARLQQAIASLDQPADSLDRSGLLLAQCRSELAESLDDKHARANRSPWLSIFSPVVWWGGLRHALIYHPAMSMTVLVVAGFLAGVAGQRLPVAPSLAVSPRPAATTASVSPNQTGSPKITEEQLRNAGSAHVAWVTPSGSRTPSVDVELMSPTSPMSIVGAPDDADVQRALTFLLENGQRFDPDVRLDSLDVLRTNAADPEVRRTLCAAARLDRNPGVRIKALEALQGFEQDPEVRDALLDALESDTSSGVRVEAIHLLFASLKSEGASAASSVPDPQVTAVLRDRLHNDPSSIVRQQSAAALHELGEQ
jgi:HEAT repeat protein